MELVQIFLGVLTVKSSVESIDRFYVLHCVSFDDQYRQVYKSSSQGDDPLLTNQYSTNLSSTVYSSLKHYRVIGYIFINLHTFSIFQTKYLLI